MHETQHLAVGVAVEPEPLVLGVLARVPRRAVEPAAQLDVEGYTLSMEFTRTRARLASLGQLLGSGSFSVSSDLAMSIPLTREDPS